MYISENLNEIYDTESKKILENFSQVLDLSYELSNLIKIGLGYCESCLETENISTLYSLLEILSQKEKFLTNLIDTETTHILHLYFNTKQTKNQT